MIRYYISKYALLVKLALMLYCCTCLSVSLSTYSNPSNDKRIKDNIYINSPLLKGKDNSLYFLSTEDGFIHAYQKSPTDLVSELKWKLNLDSPLTKSTIDIKNVTLDNINILPGGDGSLYLTNIEESTVEKLDISIKSFIANSPFTLPVMPDVLFIGDKSSIIYTIDVEEGKIVSKMSSNVFLNFDLPVISRSKRNLITVIRTDFTLRTVMHNSSHELWNVTVSDVIVLDRGGKKEVTYEEYYSDSTGKEEEISMINESFNSIGKIRTIHKYEAGSNLPIQMFSYSRNDEEFVHKTNYNNNNNKNNTLKSYDQHINFCKLKKFLKETLKRTKHKTDFFFFINSDYFNIYTLLILILTIFSIIATYFFIKFYRHNVELTNQIKQFKDRENYDSISAKSTNSKLDKSMESIKNMKDKKYKNYIDNRVGFPVLNDNFEGHYNAENNDNEDNNLNNIDRSLLDNELDGNLENDNSINSNNSNNSNNNSMNSYNYLFHGQDYKIEYDIDKSKKSQKSLRSVASKKSDCQLEIITSEAEFNYQTKNPFLQEAFQINHKRTDMSSLTECIVEENEDGIKKTELRKIVTLYEKENKGRARSFEDQPTTTLDLPMTEMSNVSLKINVNAELTKSNMKLCWETTDFISSEQGNDGCNNNENIKNIYKTNFKETGNDPESINSYFRPNSQNFQIKPNSDFSSLLYQENESKLRRLYSESNLYNSDKKCKRKFSLNEIYKQELLTLEEHYLLSTKEKLGLSKINESFLMKKEISLTQKHMEILKLINELSNSNDSQSFISDDLQSNLDPSSENSNKLNKDIFDTGRFIKNFEEITMIGKGGFGFVFKARHKIDGSEYAIKIIKLKISAKENLSDQEVVKEIKTMMKLHNKNVVRYITCWFELNEYNLNVLKKSRSKSTHSNNRGNSNKNNKNEKNEKNNKEKNHYHHFNNYNHDTNKKNKISESNKCKKYGDNEIEDSIEMDSEKYKNSNVQFGYDSKVSGHKENHKEEVSFIHDDSEIKISNRKLKLKPEPRFTVYFYMQIEYCKGFPLSYYLENRKSETEESLIFYMFKQILSALHHIHHHNIIHRDLKPANIFIHGYFNLKIGDFGLATESTRSLNELKENVGTPLYQSPEQMEGKPYNERVDIYSLGLILLELCAFFKTQTERRIVLENLRINGIIPSTIQNKYPNDYNLIKLMTNKCPEKRPSTMELLNSNLYKNIRGSSDYLENEDY